MTLEKHYQRLLELAWAAAPSKLPGANRKQIANWTVNTALGLYLIEDANMDTDWVDMPLESMEPTIELVGSVSKTEAFSLKHATHEFLAARGYR